MRAPQLPQRLQWDHNAHYHPWLLRQLPPRIDRALDVGCGAGELARQLAARAGQVDAIDIAPAMIERARALTPVAARIQWFTGDLLDPASPLAPATYDTVTAVSSLHHMPLEPALARLAALVRPGGVLVVIGLARPASPADLTVAALGFPANAVVGLVRAVRGRAGKPHDEGMPIREPATTLGDIRSAAEMLVPGARLRRHLFWRYSLVWRRPDEVGHDCPDPRGRRER